jgi:protease-4
MRFLRGLWKVLVGIKDALVLLLLLVFFGALYAMLSATPHAGGPSRGALTLTIDGPIVEQPAAVDPFTVATGGAAPREYRLTELIHALRVASTDPGIEAVALDLDIFAGGRQTALSDLGAEIRRVRAEGKRVVAYATAYDDDTYQLAAQADEVWLNPLGAVVIAGPGGANLYYAGLLERLGITANIYRVGAFKSAVEPFSRNDMSPEARQANQALADTLWSQWREEVGKARPQAQLNAYIAAPGDAVARFNGDMAEAARQLGLVDRVGDRTAFQARMAELVGEGEDRRPGSFRSVAYDNFIQRHPMRSGGGNIGVLTVAGDIVDGEGGPGTAAAESVVRALEEGLRDHDFSALVVRIDSPGGSTLASERIRQAVANVRSRGKPVVISMGSVAASGGYWIAAAGDRIFAEPSTITGSIGVFGILPSFQGALGKLGVGVDGVQTTPLSGQPDLLRGPSDEANRFLQMGVEGTYRRFLTLVAEARKLPVERVHEIAQGRVWDGGSARQLGLVDQFGGLDEAIAEAAKRAQIDVSDARPVFLEPEPDWWTQWLGGMTASRTTISPDPFGRLAQRPEALLHRALNEAGRLLRGSSIQARCLECPAAYDLVPAPGQTSGWWEVLLSRLAR